jgi:hypothetical protein
MNIKNRNNVSKSIITVSKKLLTSAEKQRESAWIPPSGAYLTWVDMSKCLLFEGRNEVVEFITQKLREKYLDDTIADVKIEPRTISDIDVDGGGFEYDVFEIKYREWTKSKKRMTKWKTL